ncbi:MAG: hypothetical protein IE926_04715 [Micrococcales bacterium]|nr:hypothetical protein [Micrococcales bacterium]
MATDDAWSATVEKKSRGLLDGSNLYRRLRVRRDDGRPMTVRVGREVWDDVSVGDRLVKAAGEPPRRA